jgi:hypothetical protein
VIIGITLAVIGILSFVCLTWSWLGVEDTRGENARTTANVIGFDITLSGETALFVLIFAAAAVGSFVHAATSFVTYAGNRTLRRSWIVWYFFRTLIGIALATVVYLVVRAGFFASATNPAEVSPFGVAAIAGLSGLFSKQATDKLQEVFDVLFKTSTGYGDEQRADKAEPAALDIDAIEPSAVPVASPDTSVQVTGRGFVAGCSVRVDDRRYDAQVVDASRLTFILAASQTALVGTRSVVVESPSGERTRSLSIAVEPAPLSSG